MTKWDYITLISKNGACYGTDGGILDLLQWCGKLNTMQVTEAEARAFWELQTEKRAGASHPFDAPAGKGLG